MTMTFPTTRIALETQERAVHDHLAATHPDWLVGFEAAIAPARWAIAQRLILALAREGLAPAQERDGALVLELPHEARLVATIARRASFGRLHLAPQAMVQDARGQRPLDHPEELLERLRPVYATDEEATRRFERFLSEIRQSVANDALARVGNTHRRERLAGEAAGFRSSLAWATERAAADPTFSPLSFYEQWVVEGHPLHPGAKIKWGLDVPEVMAYSPEWGATPAVRLVAMARTACRRTTADDEGPAAILSREYPGLAALVTAQLAARGLDPAAYEWLPMHPFQFERTLPTLGAEAIASGDLVPLDDVAIPTRALVSFRSLAPEGPRRGAAHHLKTAVAVQTTGAVRTVSPQSAQNGPRLTQLMRLVAAFEGGFKGRFRVLEERAGLSYAPGETLGTAAWRSDCPRHFAALVRENPEAGLAPDEVAMPASALVAVSPLGDRLVVEELLEAFQAETGCSDRREAAVAFVAAYAEVALPGFLTHMTGYGLALEGHLQNSVPVFRRGVPVRMLVRDMGGVRLLDERLQQVGLAIVLAPGSAIRAVDERDLRNKIFYPFFQNHLGELLGALAHAVDVPELALWAPVARTARAVLRGLAETAAWRKQALADEQALFAPELELKAMVAMRLAGEVTTYTFARVSNPLVEAGGAV